MKINHRHYVLLLISIVTLIAVIVGYYVIYKQTKKQANYYVSASNEIENEHSKKQIEIDMQKIHEDTKEERLLLKDLIIKEENVVKFIELVEKVGEESNTKLELSTLTKDTEKVKAKIIASGSWGNVMTALGLLENLPLSTVVSNLHLGTTVLEEKDAKKTVVWNLSVDIETLIKK
jgi:hypothetical protein